jgi:GMP synthase PP-ATPase subunit
VQIKLGNYEQAIKSYHAVQKIYPSIKAAKVMIPQLRKLIKDEVI